MRRSLDLYSEKQAGDAGPDKIAASKAFCNEANSVSFAFGQQPKEDASRNSAFLSFKDDAFRISKDSIKEPAKEITHKEQQLKDAHHETARDQLPKDIQSIVWRGQKPEIVSSASGYERKGLMSLFDPEPQNLQMSQRDKDKLAALAKTNPLLLIRMGNKMDIPPEIRRLANQVVYDDSVVCERFHRLAARQAFLIGDEQVKETRKTNDLGQPPVDQSVTVSQSSAESQKDKVKPLGDRLSIVRDTRKPENLKTWASKDIEKTKKLRKQKQMLTDYLEKFRGTLSLKEVSDVISQIERLDKTLLLLAS